MYTMYILWIYMEARSYGCMYGYRVIDDWNHLPYHIVNANSLNSFKRLPGLNTFMIYCNLYMLLHVCMLYFTIGYTGCAFFP